eukprot:CAMPEP_0178954688 /NCGR_PEP_ID=MMETSP0789-20121207/9143_1 /TAXON_ID=3005 /ORGANISM="Rhizosolenia setigera, Strain CCMP 1694" /LENGTH=192 /DNA_ID=CAMNT_0020636145 /DNA_START=151 /DNA_END=729 /DNA_ORIENTATION=+
MPSMRRGIITPQPPTFISGMTNNREYSLLYSSANDATDVRSKMRSLTGVSLSAMRASVRAATGLSLTAMRSTLRVATGVSVTGIMDKIVGVFPLWFRAFIQPFLILYYVPLLLLKGLIGPTKTSKKDQLQSHDAFVNHLKEAVKIAEAEANTIWPVHIANDGNIDSSLDTDDENVVDALVKSVDVAQALCYE